MVTLTDKILKVLERVPVPFLPQAAQVAEGILLVYHEAHADAVAAGVPPPTFEEMRQAIIDGAVAAGEPWQRIQQRAGGGDPRGEIVTGSTGD